MLIAPPTTRDIDGASVTASADRGTITILAIHNVVGGYQDDQSGYSCRGCRTVYPHAYDVTDDSYIELAADAAVTLAGRLLELTEPLTTNENEGHQHD